MPRESSKISPLVYAHVIFILGVIWRWYFIAIHHPLEASIYSDMKGYLGSAKAFFDSSHPPTVIESLHPPGTAFYFGLLYILDPTWRLATLCQFLLSLLVPLILWALGHRLFSSSTGITAYVASSLYFPYIHYFGFFLSEGPFIFFTLLTFLLCVFTQNVSPLPRFVMMSIITGIFFSTAYAFKNSILAPAVFLLITLLLFSKKKNRARVCLFIGAAIGGALPLFIGMSMRCTRLNDGNFCFVSQNFGYNVLMGHFDERREFHWHDQEGGASYVSMSPSAAQKGMRGKIHLPFGILDNQKNLEFVWGWIKQHPFPAIVTSFENIFDLFTGGVFWPIDNRWVQVLYSQLFLMFLLLPATCWIWKNLRPMIKRDPAVFAEAITLAPLLGIMATVFITVAEPRYRIPFDGFIILLAAQFFTNQLKRRSVPDSEKK